MGTPELTLDEAIQFFASLGLDGIEIIVETDGYKSAIPLEATGQEIAAVKRKVAAAGLAVAGLTPYLNLFNSLEEEVRQAECQSLKKVIDMAAALGAKNIRIYGGKLVQGEADEDGRKLVQLVKSMRECGDYSAPHGIRLNLENHFGTMTTTAEQTMAIVEAIGHPNVGVLYDQANLAFFPAEEYAEAISIQKRAIHYVHCKDLVYRDDVPVSPVFTMVSHVSQDERTVRSRIPGQGILEWPAILKSLADIGYGGWISLEYERRWGNADLPDAREGMPIAARYIRDLLSRL